MTAEGSLPPAELLVQNALVRNLHVQSLRRRAKWHALQAFAEGAQHHLLLAESRVLLAYQV